MVVFDNYLYSGTFNRDGCQIWRTTASGDPPFDWEEVRTDGFGDTSNWFTFSMIISNNHLYAGTGNVFKGCQIWRTNAVGTPPFNWEKVNDTDGFGDSKNHHAVSMVVFDDYLYVGTSTDKYSEPPYSCEVWRTAAIGDIPFNDWEQVNADGFGDPGNGGVASMAVFDNQLYVGTGNNNGCEVWCFDGQIETTTTTSIPQCPSELL